MRFYLLLFGNEMSGTMKEKERVREAGVVVQKNSINNNRKRYINS